MSRDERADELAKLMKEHPYMAVIPLVRGEKSIRGGFTGREGKWVGTSIRRYVEMYKRGHLVMFFEDDENDIEELKAIAWSSSKPWDSPDRRPSKEFFEGIENQWKEAIFLDIEI